MLLTIGFKPQPEGEYGLLQNHVLFKSRPWQNLPSRRYIDIYRKLSSALKELLMRRRSRLLLNYW